MDMKKLARLLRRVERGEVSVSDAAEKIAALGTADLGFARIDHHRQLRRGFPEVVLGEGKTAEQVVEIVRHLISRDAPVLVTRLSPEVGEALDSEFRRGRFDEIARTFLAFPKGRPRRPRRGLAIVSAGTADQPVAEEAAVAAEAFSIEPERIYDVGVAGLHRLLDDLPRLRAARVIIVVAGMEGALPSVVAGLVEAPVIGVPTSVGYGAAQGGMTALMGMLTSCAEGLSVVNIDNGFGAACAARAMLRIGSRKR